MITQKPLTTELRSNIHHLYADITWYGILAGSTIAFLAIFITRLGANSLHVSLLTAGPALVNLFFSLPAGNWLQGKRLISITFWSAIWFRLGYIAFIPLAWIFDAPSEIWVVVLIISIMSIPGTLLTISFNAVFAEVIPPDWRGQVVGKRNALLAVSLTATTLVCGFILDRVLFPANYQIVFLMGAIGAALSTYHIGRLATGVQTSPLRAVSPIGVGIRSVGMRLKASFRSLNWKHLSAFRPRTTIFEAGWLKGSFGRFMLAYLVFYFFQNITMPIFPLVSVRVLNLTDGQISLGNALFYATMLLLSLRLGRLSDWMGHRKMLIVGSFGYILYPLLFGLAKDATLYWVASLIGGAVWALVSAGLINRLMEVVGETDRPGMMAVHNLVMNLGILAGSLAAPVLVETIGIRQSILTSAGLRFFAGILFLLWG